MSFTINKKSNLKQKFLDKTGSARKAHAGKVAIKSAAAIGAQNDLSPYLEIEWHAISDLQPPRRRVAYSFMDWRSIDLLMNAARDAGLNHINTAVWYKGAGAMGSLTLPNLR